MQVLEPGEGDRGESGEMDKEFGRRYSSGRVKVTSEGSIQACLDSSK